MFNLGEEIMFRTDLLDQPSILDEYSKVSGVMGLKCKMYQCNCIMKLCAEVASGFLCVKSFVHVCYNINRKLFLNLTLSSVQTFKTCSELGACVSHPHS